MVPGVLDLTMYRGGTFGPITAQCLTGPPPGGVPVPLTGYVAEAQVRAAPGKPLILNLAPMIPNPVDGKIVMYFTDEQTAAINVHGDFVWDLWLINPSGERLGPFLAGKFSIKTAVTKP